MQAEQTVENCSCCLDDNNVAQLFLSATASDRKLVLSMLSKTEREEMSDINRIGKQ